MMKPVALITGASSGFGEASARLLAPHYRLILVARRLERLTHLQEELQALTEVYPLELDVRHQADVSKAIDSLPDSFSAIDLLINNAGLALGLEGAWECDLEDWERMVDTNIKGVLYCTRAILPQMVERNRGYIINIGSIAGNWPYAGGNVYGATKAFIEQFSRNLRCDLAGKRIRVTTLKPGMAESEFSLVRFKGDEERAKKVYEGIEPLTPEDIAATILYLVSLPERINVNEIEVMPLCQSFGRTTITPVKE